MLHPLARSVALLAIVILAAPLVAQAPSRPLDRLFQSTLESQQLAGMSGSVIRGDRVVWSGGFGLADIESGRRVREDTIFHQGSVSKTVTATALVDLIERKHIPLDAAVDPYLPFRLRNPRFPEAQITFRMLLNHTAGISDVQPGNNRMTFLNETSDSKTPLGDVLQAYLTPGGAYYGETNFGASAPGTHFEYSNVSYAVIGFLVERISGEPFDVYTRKRLFVPLGMRDTTWRIAEVDPQRFAFQYVRDAKSATGRRKIAPFTWPGYMDGGLRTSALDYSRFLVMLMNGGRSGGRRVLSKRTVATLLAPQKLSDVPAGRLMPTIDRSPSWAICSYKGRTVYQFNGYGPSFFTLVWFDPAAKIGGTIFTTGEAASMPMLGKAMLEIIDEMIRVAQAN